LLSPSPGYDDTLTIFSPDGRLFQVEYALEAVRRGTTIIGLRCTDGVVLAAQLRVHPLQERTLNDKIFKIDEAIGAAASGLSADARALVAQARILAQIHKLTYGEPIPVRSLTKQVCDYIQSYTQHAGVRPFGASLMVVGVEEAPQLFVTDPIGSFWSYKAHAVGQGASTAIKILEKEYSPAITVEDGLILAIQAIKNSARTPLTPDMLDAAVIPSDKRCFTRLDTPSLSSLLEHAKKMEKGE